MEMYSLTKLYDSDTRFLPAHHQPAILIDLAASRGIDTHRLLRGTHIFYEDVIKGQLQISINQYLQLIDNAQKLFGARDLSFLFGSRLLPGNYDAFTMALNNAANLQQALEILVEFAAVLSPLVRPTVFFDDKHCYIRWLGGFANLSQKRFAIEATYLAVASFSRGHIGKRVPWQFYFSYEKPDYSEQYDVYFGSRVQFNTHMDLLRVERSYLAEPWLQASQTAQHLAQQRAKEYYQALPSQTGFIDYLYQYVWDNIGNPPTLESLAQHLCTSPATLKRRLKANHLTFQQLIDKVRKHVAIQLFYLRGFSNDQVAETLGFHDVNNFRRSFKRWTGVTPSSFRGSLSSPA